MRLLAAILLLLIATAMSPAPASSAEAQAGSVRIERPWARASIGTSRPAAAYLTLINTGDRIAWLVGVASPVAGRAEPHRTVKDSGVMKMAPAEGVEIPAGGRVLFEPGGLHVMLMDLKRPLKEGETFPLTLRFDGGAEATVTVPVLGPGAMEPRDGE